MGVPRVTDYCRGPGIYAAYHPHLAPSGLRRSLNAVGDAPQRGLGKVQQLERGSTRQAQAIKELLLSRKGCGSTKAVTNRLAQR
jgi:hypothetical protein